MCRKFFLLISFLSVLALVSTNVVFGDVIEIRVAADEDDSEEDVATGVIDLTSSDLEITEEGEPALNQLVGLRFNNIDVPQGAIITNAYVQFQVDEIDVPGDNRPGTKFLRGEAVDNAAAFSDAAFDISSRPTTSAEASWDWPLWLTEDEEGPDQQTSDIAAVIQEIVDRPGWSPGNSLALIITGSGENCAEAFEGEADAAPLLHIEFGAAPAPAERKMDNWEGAAAADAPGFLATNVPDGVYDIGAFSGDITYEFCVLSNPDETEASMCLIGRRDSGDTNAGIKFDQYENTGEYGATVFGVVDLYYGVPYSGGVDTHLAFVSSEDAGTTALYENGVYKGSVDSAITLSGLVGIGYGAQDEATRGSATFDNFDGDIFGVAIYDTALSDEEIAAHSDAFLGRVVKVNFQSLTQGSGEVPAGYLPDYGEVFGGRGNGFNYGWNKDIQGDARDRDSANAVDQRYDTLNHLQKADDAVWEIELPNGTYNVFMVNGDPDNTDQTNNFDVEGVVVVDPDGEDNFDEYNVTVVVSDGLLTIKPGEAALNCKIMFVDITALVDVTAPGDLVQGVPNDGLMDGDNFGWPGAETPDLAIDDDTGTKFLHFKGELEPTGIQVTPAAGPSIVTGLTLTTANDAIERDPVTFELSGSNESIDGPYELIASGDIVDFAQADAWPRFTMNATPISFDNDVIYAHYQVLFPAVRDAGSANSMQIAEVELLGVRAYPPAGPIVHYKLDDGEGVIAVDSANGLDGILMGDPQWSAGVLGGALDFDGDGDYVDCGTNATLNGLSDAITVSAWVNIRSVTTTWMGIVMKGETAWRLGVNGDTTGIHWGFTGGDRGWQAANSVTELPLDEWHHIAATYDKSVGGTNYVDGVAEAVNPDPDGVAGNEMPLLLGENPEALGRLFDGLLDDVRIYDRALSADEISGLATLEAPANILANGGFEDGVVEPWGFWGDATAEVVTELVGAAVPEAPIEGDSCLHITVNSAGANDWDYGLNQGGHVFEAGKKYTVSAFLKCKEGTLDIRIKPERGEDPWEGYSDQVFTMTDQWAEYSVTTPVFTEDVSPASITFHIAFAPGEFWVDDVRFVEVE